MTNWMERLRVRWYDRPIPGGLTRGEIFLFQCLGSLVGWVVVAITFGMLGMFR